MRKVLVILILLVGVLVLPSVVSAATVEGVAQKVADTAVKVGYAAVIIFWVVTGILFLSAAGSPEKLSTAKKALFMAIAGTAIIIIAVSAISFVGGALGI